MEFALYKDLLNRQRIYFVGFSLAIILSLIFITARVAAQSADSWSEPVNLSQSGSATDPSLVIDSEGIYHVLWNDEFAGLVYVTGDGNEWSAPTPIELPSKDVMPFFIADTNGFVHAFWREVDERPFSEDKLFYSRVSASAFPRFSYWSAKALIAESPLDFDVAIDGNGDLHLSYVKSLETEESPAGVYYRRLRAGSSNWSAPGLLYASPYFRSLELVDSNVDVSSSMIEDSVRVFVAWDNRPRERVYLAASEDAGQTWSLPIEVDQPQDGLVGSGPSDIVVDSEGEDVMLLWRKGSSDSFCDQYFQWSEDGGNSWGFKQPMFASIPSCFTEFQLLHSDQDPILMGKADQVYMIAWDGSRWSDPQLQGPLTSFVDPDTQNIINIGCYQSSLVVSNNLYIVGCDDEIGKDIWLLNRQLLDVPSWYPEEAVWSPVLPVNNSEQRNSIPALVSDSQERMHAVWSQADSVHLDGLGKVIFHARWEEGRWSLPEEVIEPAEGKVEQPAVAIGDQDQLYVVWSGGQDGEIYFSTVDASQAVVPTYWSEPIQLPSPSMSGSAPSIVVDEGGVIYVSFAIPLNESRGIYLVISEDEGQTWSEPKLVFDAEAASWSMVDNPRLAVTGQKNLHVLWTRSTLPSGQGPLSLLYSLSKDGGETWSLPQMVVENPIVWSQIVGIGKSTVQRVWQETGLSSTIMWHEESLDKGQSWLRTVPVSVFGELEGYPSLTSDKAGRLHLLFPVRNDPDSFVVQHWLYDEGRWSAERSLDLTFPASTNIYSIVGHISESGNLGVLISNILHNVENFSHQFQLDFFFRPLDISTSTSTPIPPVVATAQTTSLPTAIQIQAESTSISITPEVTGTPANIPVEPNSSNSSSWITIAGPAFIGLIVLVAIIIIFRVIRNWR